MHEEQNIGTEHDGARILWRHWYGDPLRPKEGIVREFSAGGRQVRICDTLASTDRGTWHEATSIKVISVLEMTHAATAEGEKYFQIIPK